MATVRSAPSKISGPRLTRILNSTLLYGFLIGGACITCFPFVWMLLTSFKTYGEAIASPPTVIANDWTQRLSVLMTLITSFPLVPVAFLGWFALGVIVTRRIAVRPVATIYLMLHLALFFVLGNLAFWGESRLGALWQQTANARGLQFEPFFKNYVEAWARAPFVQYFRNSIIISTLTPLLIVLTSAPAAYAFARLDFPAKNVLFLVYLATMMVPSEVLLIPNFITISQLGWKNTYLALIVPFSVSVLSIFFLRQFFRSVPNDLYDAATIDGCGHPRFLLSIALPLARPALVSTAMFNFLASWNSLLWPLLVTDKQSMRPITLGLASYSSDAGMQVQLYMAAATFSILPIVIIFMFVQKQFIEGIARTGIK